MTTNIIIFVIVAIVIAVAAYYLGKANGWQEGCKESSKNTLNLPSPVDTLSRVHAIRTPKYYLTRYVRMDKECVPQVNDEIEVLEKDGFTVDDYDADDGIITMTKGVYGPDVEKIEETSARAAE